MINEIKRGLFSKKSLILFIFILIIILATCFTSTGWKTYHMSIGNDLADVDLSEINYIRNLHGNVFKLWKSSLYTFKILLPLLLMIPYIMTYIDERNSKYRYYINIRGNKCSYLFNKIVATVLSTIFVIFIAEIISMFIIYLGSANSNFTPELMENIVVNKYEYLFMSHPYHFFGYFILIQLLFSFSFMFFAFGIASFVRNKFLIIVIPFIIYVVLSLILPYQLKISTITDVTHPNFEFFYALIVIFAFFITGIIMLYFNEKKFKREGVI